MSEDKTPKVTKVRERRGAEVVHDCYGCEAADPEKITFAEREVGERAAMRLRRREVDGWKPAKPEDLKEGYDGYVGADGFVHKGGDLLVMVGSREKAENKELDRLQRLRLMDSNQERAFDEESKAEAIPGQHYTQRGRRSGKSYFYGK